MAVTKVPAGGFVVKILSLPIVMNMRGENLSLSQ